MSEIEDTANSLYFEEDKEEQGIKLSLEENLRNNFVGLISDRFISAENSLSLIHI